MPIGPTKYIIRVYSHLKRADMGSVLNGLTQLQSVENHLRACKAKLARCRRNVILQENRVRNLQSDLAAKHDEIQLMKVQSDRLQLELNSRDESIAKVRAALNTAKTNYRPTYIFFNRLYAFLLF